VVLAATRCCCAAQGLCGGKSLIYKSYNPEFGSKCRCELRVSRSLLKFPFRRNHLHSNLLRNHGLPYANRRRAVRRPPRRSSSRPYHPLFSLPHITSRLRSLTRPLPPSLRRQIRSSHRGGCRDSLRPPPLLLLWLPPPPPLVFPPPRPRFLRSQSREFPKSLTPRQVGKNCCCALQFPPALILLRQHRLAPIARPPRQPAAPAMDERNAVKAAD